MPPQQSGHHPQISLREVKYRPLRMGGGGGAKGGRINSKRARIDHVASDHVATFVSLSQRAHARACVWVCVFRHVSPVVEILVILSGLFCTRDEKKRTKKTSL